MPRVRPSAALTLIVLGLLPTGLGAVEDSESHVSYDEIHTWVPASVAIYSDGTEVHCPGYWKIIRRPIALDGDGSINPPPAPPPETSGETSAEPPAEVTVQGPTVEVEVAAPVCTPAVEFEHRGPASCRERPLCVVTPVVPAVPQVAFHGFWRTISAPWHDPACFRASISPGGFAGHGGDNHQHWSLPRLPFSPLAPLRLLGHLR